MPDVLCQSPAAAWKSVLGAIRRFGAYYSVEFDDPQIAAVVQKMGGWIALCGRSSRNLQSVGGAEFRVLYSTLEGSAEPVRLVGIIERDNPGGRGNVLRVSVGVVSDV